MGRAQAPDRRDHRSDASAGAARPQGRRIAVQQRSRKRTTGRARPASQLRLSRKASTPADKLAPEDQALREFIADLYAALSIMRLLRGQIGRTLALSSAQFSVLLGVWHLERRGEPTVKAIADHLHVAAAHVTAEIGGLCGGGGRGRGALRAATR